jgi:hypothetical protein
MSYFEDSPPPYHKVANHYSREPHWSDPVTSEPIVDAYHMPPPSAPPSDIGDGHRQYQPNRCTHFSKDVWQRLKSCRCIEHYPHPALLGIFLASLLITLMIFFLCVKPDLQYKDPHVETICTYGKTQLIQNRCCDIINCKCSECGSAPSCLSLKSNQSLGLLEDSISCCNGYRCCNSGRDTCFRDVYYDCWCYDVGDKRYCSTCHDSVGYPCGPEKCWNSVSNDLCTQVCGICSQLITTYYYNVTNREQFVTSVLKTSCGRDDFACIHSWQQTHPEGQEQSCWYDSNNWAGGAVYEKPVYHWNIAAMVFTIIFGSLCVILILVIIWLMFVRKSWLHNQLDYNSIN